MLTKQGRLSYYYTNKQTPGNIKQEKRGELDVIECEVTLTARTLEKDERLNPIFTLHARNLRDNEMEVWVQ